MSDDEETKLVDTLISAGENQTVEFKKKEILKDKTKIARLLTSFANTIGGRILVGVCDDGTLEGMRSKKEHETHIMNIARDLCDPSLTPQFSRIRKPRGDIYMIKVSRYRVFPHAVKTREGNVYFVRAGTTVRPATPYELALLFEPSGYSEPESEFSERSVEHSQLLNDDAIKPWLGHFSFYSGLTSGDPRIIKGVKIETNASITEFRPFEPCDPQVQFFPYLKQHLETGYQDIFEDWERLKKDILSFNRKRVEFLSKMNSKIFEKMNAKADKEPPYWSYRKPMCVVDRKFAMLVYSTLLKVAVQGKKPIAAFHEERGIKLPVHELQHEGILLLKSNRVRDLRKGQDLFKELTSAQDNVNETKKAGKTEMLLEKRGKALEEKLVEVRDSIDLGNVLKGECKHCPKRL